MHDIEVEKNMPATEQNLLKALNRKKLGFGTLRLPYVGEDSTEIDMEQLKIMIDAYIDAGFNYFEAARIYHKGNNEIAIRKCLTERYDRCKYLLADKMPVNSKALTDLEQYEKMFQQSMYECGVEYFDFYLLHNLGYSSYIKTENIGGFSFLTDIKKRGLAKYIGFSFHDSAEILDEILSHHRNELDFVQLQINYLDWESPVVQSKLCYEVACKHNIPIFVMEAAKGGRLALLPDEAKQLLFSRKSQASIVSYAYRFAASLDGVALVLSGMSNLEQVVENVSEMKYCKPLSDKEYETLKDVVAIINKNAQIQCTDCRYCVDVCPKKIPIPLIFDVYNGMQIVGAIYGRFLRGKSKASDCLKCGNCEAVCSQKIEIIKQLDKIASVYEKSTTSKSNIKSPTK